VLGTFTNRPVHLLCREVLIPVVVVAVRSILADKAVWEAGVNQRPNQLVLLSLRAGAVASISRACLEASSNSISGRFSKCERNLMK